jgi:CRISPR/Cas system-associated exonuclease Cas4 (RecB family)
VTRINTKNTLELAEMLKEMDFKTVENIQKVLQTVVNMVKRKGGTCSDCTNNSGGISL